MKKQEKRRILDKMGKPRQAAELLMQGNSPSKIAREMGITLASVMNYLYLSVGQGIIRRSDIVFSIDEEIRNKIELLYQQRTFPPYIIFQLLTKKGQMINKGDVDIYCSLRDTRISLGDMYEDIRYIETQLHSKIKKILINEFGIENWWIDGIPLKIRCRAADSRERDRERDAEPNEEYCYTRFIDLKKILEAKWSIFSKFLPKNVVTNKGELLTHLDKLNKIRNSVMHPVKNHNFTDKEFSFVRIVKEYLQLDKW